MDISTTATNALRDVDAFCPRTQVTPAVLAGSTAAVAVAGRPSGTSVWSPPG